MDSQETLNAVRHAILEWLAVSRANVDKLHRQGGTIADLKWQQGFQAALKGLLELEGVDIRRNPRRSTALPSEIVLRREAPGAPGRTGEGTIMDLSVGGCRVTTPLELAVGEITELSFRVPSSDKIITVKATVRGVERTHETRHVGNEFQDVPEDICQVLQEFCAGSGSSD